MFENANEETPMLSESHAMQMIAIYNDDIEKADALLKLQEDKSFQSLVMDSYFKNEAVRLTSLLATAPQGDRPKIVDDLYAISAFSAYLTSVNRDGDTAVSNKAELQQAIIEMHEAQAKENPDA